MQNRIFLVVAASLAFSCSTLPSRRYSRADLQEKLQEHSIAFSDDDLASLDAARPQLAAPIRLGIAPPLESQDQAHGWYAREDPRSFGVWSPDEREAIRKAARKLQRAGLVDDVVFLPNVLVGADEETAGGDVLGHVRAAAVRHHVDAVLVVNSLSSLYSRARALAILDLTLIGAAIFPGHTVHADTVAEAIVVDARSGYLHLSGFGTGEAKKKTTAMEVGIHADRVLEKSRVEAITALAKDLRQQALDQQRGLGK
ncbi:MAG: hypothetical protein GY711_21990 [bacterium]|nr:hypothetical protein [bacterium]